VRTKYTCSNEFRLTVLCFVVTSVGKVNSLIAYLCNRPLGARAAHCTNTSWVKWMAAGCTDSPMPTESMDNITKFKILLLPHVLYLAPVQRNGAVMEISFLCFLAGFSDTE
jgi:hypothetical protein